jgi:hypothetical protein
MKGYIYTYVYKKLPEEQNSEVRNIIFDNTHALEIRSKNYRYPVSATTPAHSYR